MTAPTNPHIAYVLKRYPRLSETFILNEIATMERLGARLSLFSLLQPEPPPHHPTVKEIKAPLNHLPALAGHALAAVAAAHGSCLVRAPQRYAHAVLRTLASSLRSTRPLGIWRQFVRAGFVADRCQRDGVTLIHAHFANAPAAVAWLASTMSGIPYSFTAHAKDLYLTNTRILRDRIQGAQFVTTCTGYNVDYLRTIALPADHDKIHLVYHGIDLARFAMRTDHAAERKAGEPLVLSVGRLVPKKGHRDLIAACHLLRQEGIRFRCAIVGDGPLRCEIKADIARRGLSGQVVLKGAMTHAELIDLYREADVFALSPRIVEDGDRDGIPNVIVEAMAIGVPVISAAVSGIPEIVQHDVTGILVPSESPAALARALRHLLGNPSTGRRLAADARARLHGNFDSRETTKALRDLMCGCGCGVGQQSSGQLPAAADPRSVAAAE